MLNTLLSFLLLAVPLSAAQPQSAHTQESAVREITAVELKSWYDEQKPMIVLDARSKPYFDGTLLPNAKWLPADSDDAAIKAAIPHQDSVVVVYCWSIECPASGWLYHKLISLGYTNVYEFSAGLHEWMERGFPTEHP